MSLRYFFFVIVGNSALFEGISLAAMEQIVMVAINYRLSPLGINLLVYVSYSD